MAWKISARYLKKDEMARWERAIKRCPWRDGSCLPLWLEIWPAEWGELKAIGLFSAEELVGGVLLTRRRRWGQWILETHPMIAYSGFWLAEPEGASPSKRETFHVAALTALDRFLAENAGKAAIRFGAAYQDIRPFIHRGWEAWTQFTYITDVENAGALEMSFENDVRRQLATAREGLVRVTQSQDFATFERLCSQTHERKELAHHYPPNFLAKLAAALDASSQGAVFSACSSSGEPLATALIGWEGDCAMYLYGGSSLQASGTGAPSLLQVEVMKALSEKGIKYYDWHGANTISIIRFKKNFNPRLAPCIVARRNYGLIGNVAHAVKDSLQRWSAGRRIQEDS